MGIRGESMMSSETRDDLRTRPTKRRRRSQPSPSVRLAAALALCPPCLSAVRVGVEAREYAVVNSQQSQPRPGRLRGVPLASSPPLSSPDERRLLEDQTSPVQYLPDHDRYACVWGIDYEPWQSGQLSPTLEGCCSSYFAWHYEGCMDRPPKESELMMYEFQQASASTAPTYQYHSSPDDDTCRNDRPLRTGEKGYKTLKKCCGNNYPGVRECVTKGEEILARAEGEAADDPAYFKYLPIWGVNKCTNDRKTFAWEGGFNTLEECCGANFNWSPAKENCLGVASDVEDEDEDGETDGGASLDEGGDEAMSPPTEPPSRPTNAVVEVSLEGYWYPSYNDGVCRLDGRSAPSFMKSNPSAFMSLSHVDCCKSQFPRGRQKCVRESGPIYLSAGGGSATTTSTAVPATTVQPALYRYHYFAHYGLTACVQNTLLEAPDYTYEAPADFLFLTVEECCLYTWYEKIEYGTCLEHSRHYALGLPYNQWHGSFDVNSVGHHLEVVFDGRLYFRNVFLPSKTASNMKVVRDAILVGLRVNMKRSLDEGGDGGFVSHLVGKTFDGVGLTDLEDAMTRRSLLLDGSAESFEEIEVAHPEREERGRRKLLRMQLFRFDMTISVPCDDRCLSDPATSGRSASFDLVDHFDGLLEDGSIMRTIKSDMESMGLVGPFYTASLPEGRLQFASASLDGMFTDAPTVTASPSESPSMVPSTAEPTREVVEEVCKYYPHFKTETCVNDCMQGEFQQNLYASLAECCRFPWLDEDTCLDRGETDAPTVRPSANPTTPSPTVRPTDKPTREPTSPPTKSNPTTRPADLAAQIWEFPTFSPSLITDSPNNQMPPTRHPPVTDWPSATPPPVEELTATPTDGPSAPPTASPASEAVPSEDVGEFAESFESGDIASSVFSTSDVLPWTVDAQIKSDGEFSATNSPTERGQSSKMTMVREFPSQGVLHFDLRSDVFMPWAMFLVSIDGDMKMSVSGNTDEVKWGGKTVNVPSGQHTIEFEVKTIDSLIPPNPRGSGKVWVDNVRFHESVIYDFDDGEISDDFESGGVGRWRVDDGQPAGGTGLAVRSQKGLLPNESCSLFYMAEAGESGSVVSFDAFLGMGTFSFLVDDAVMHRSAMPGAGVRRISILLPPGQHALEWRYEAPVAPNIPLSAVWVDNISFDVVGFVKN
ncbi:hypothetical protein THAOC_10313 [Thalassiosira oceanica]|uniref:Uncharacterized protein n=1 Tax=Thalassiosira oceanica TaxID=159749 RepID=K0T576_THAOC|nr:hypothetical protein THAOC_10313 [Thalassiosira oceanica]|eukprot:EJK68496.1 hypothetical protein THAOC_10313 [Thalassiosira oceanica]